MNPASIPAAHPRIVSQIAMRLPWCGQFGIASHADLMLAVRRSIIGFALLAMLQTAILPAAMAGAPASIPLISTRVTDLTGTLSEAERASLEQTLQAFEARKGSQLLVLIIGSTTPETIEQYALRVVEQAKPGRKKIDDGALLLVAKNDRTMRIEVGYGLEGALNDAISKRIISEVITPRFKQDDYYGGISAGVMQMIRVIDGEPLPVASQRRDGELTPWQQHMPIIFLLAAGVGIVMRVLLGRFKGALATGTLVLLAAWLLVGALSVALMAGLIAMMFTLFGGRMGGLWPGGGMGGGGNGGGFSGGGGGFGGGGASGRW